MKGAAIFLLCLLSFLHSLKAASPKVAFDMVEAQEICNSLPLENIEGIWLYPDDNVSVLILHEEKTSNSHQMPKYVISVVESSDTRLSPGDVIGNLTSTPEERTYKIELATERKNELLLKPKSCLAKLSSDGDYFILKKQKTGIKGRLSLNFTRLLPGFWKIVSTGISSGNSGSKIEPSAGMVKLYPSYDGNGSSKRKPRYL